mmetsp:Transcript_90916/g.252951  ORF Transcript_90916/g.252951 Transcript_90916/m.252951 type:complete len:205 (+) Transcript_90916:1069-1683(+)
MMSPHSVVHTVAGVARVPVCLRDIVGQLRLVEEDLAILADPLDLVLQSVLHSQPVDRNIFASHDQAGVARVHLPLDDARDAVVGSPEPEVVPHDVPRGDAQHRLQLRLRLGGIVGAAHAHEDVVQEARVKRAARVRPVAKLQKSVRGAEAGLQEDPRDAHAIDVPHPQRRGTLRGNQRGKADAQQNLVVSADLQWGLQVVDARS